MPSFWREAPRRRRDQPSRSPRIRPPPEVAAACASLTALLAHQSDASLQTDVVTRAAALGNGQYAPLGFVMLTVKDDIAGDATLPPANPAVTLADSIPATEACADLLT